MTLTPTVFHDMPSAYLALRDHIYDAGHLVAPRGELTREILGASFIIEDAVRRGVPVGVGRKVGVKMQAIDGTGNLGGCSYPDVAIRLAPVMDRFADILPAAGAHPDWLTIGRRTPQVRSGERFLQGAYGPRIGEQMPRLEAQLRRDPSTRQAVATLWSETDRDPTWADRPCTTQFQLMVRDDALDIHVSMRANDLWTGTCYDVFQFAQIQAAMAHILGIPHGRYYHHATSLHIYARDADKMAALHPGVHNPRESFGPDWDALAPGTYPDWGTMAGRFQLMLSSISTGFEFEPANPVEDWYYQVMRPATHLASG